VFSRLIAGDEEKGFCDVVLHGQTTAHAQYVRNTAIVETVLEDASGNAVRITDFAPRFLRFDRAFHPAQIVRRIEPLRGFWDGGALGRPGSLRRRSWNSAMQTSSSHCTGCVSAREPRGTLLYIARAND